MKEAKKLSKKDIQKHLQATKKAIAAGKVVTINPNAVINIPVAGAFRDYIAEAINYLFTIKDEDTITSTLMHIRDGFKSLPEDAPYDPYMNAVWTLMTLMTEINHQAAEQGHTVITDENVDESVSNLVNSFTAGNEEDTKAILKESKINYEKTRSAAEEKWSKEDEEKKMKALLDKEIKKDKNIKPKSNED